MFATVQSGFFLMFSGLFEQIRGRPAEAIRTFQSAIAAFKQWPQLHSACHWLMIWCHATLGKTLIEHRSGLCDLTFDRWPGHWDDAAKYATLMSENCRWSPCTSTYQLAVCLYMKLEEDLPHLTESQQLEIRSRIRESMKRAPTLKHSVAGKTLFVEKFVTKRCAMFFEENEQMMLPILGES